jgi:hypothetical protein
MEATTDIEKKSTSMHAVANNVASSTEISSMESTTDVLAKPVFSHAVPSIQMQPVEEEEEMVQTKPLFQLQPIEEEQEELMPKLQMQPMEEEEEILQPKWIQKAGCTNCGEKEMREHQTSNRTIQLSPLSHIDSCGGHPLSNSNRGFFESRMGYNFSNVRVHTCDSAVQMNQQLGAHAFTYGNNIFFNKGQYNTGSIDGKKLLAHELTHVIQQNNSELGISKMIQRYDWGMHDVPGMAEERPPQCPVWIAADHRTVSRLIGEIRRNHNDDMLLCFSEIHRRRNQLENCCDLNYTAADHYFWLRMEVGSGNWSYTFAQFVIGLGMIGRIVLGARGPRTGNCPMSPYSNIVTAAEMLGARDGRNDARRREAGE